MAGNHHKSTPQAPTALHAAWVWCGPGRLLSDAWVTLAGGRVQAVDSRPPSGARRRELGRGLLLPGLVNAHTHLELSFLAGLVPPRGDFVGWLEELVALRPGHDRGSAGQAALDGARRLADEGVALAGDVTNTGRAVAAWRRAGISVVNFFEALGAANAEPPGEELCWEEPGRCLAAAVAAHAPYSVPAGRLAALKARSRRLPFCIHLAESRAEMEFFAGSGREGRRLEEFLRRRGVSKAALELRAEHPLEHLAALGVLATGTLLVHGVQLDPALGRRLAAAGVSLCLCPRSNLGLTGRVAPVLPFWQEGVNLALGTDSLASTPSLSLWEELLTLRRLEPALPAEALITMATLGGARALGLGDHFGSISPGAVGRLCLVPLERISGERVLEAVARGDWLEPPRAVTG